MHERQTVEFVKSQHEKWCSFDRHELTVMEALHLLDDFVDAGDANYVMPNSYHAFQTAELIRKEYPDLDWFHLTGLIHDIGKIMALDGQEQWCTVGNTYPVGMPPRETIRYGVESFTKNPDLQNTTYQQSPLGMYEKGCGLDRVLMSWGHDEYLYQALKNHPECSLPQAALWIVRYHSFFPWHHLGDYQDITNNDDVEALKWVKLFKKFDVYSKTEVLPDDMDSVRSYYQSLIDKYIPGKIKF